MLLENVLESLRIFIKDEIIEDGDVDLQNDLPLLEYGIIDSLAIVSVLAFIDQTFDVQIPEDEIIPKNFETLNAIANLVIENRPSHS